MALMFIAATFWNVILLYKGQKDVSPVNTEKMAKDADLCETTSLGTNSEH